MRKFILLLIVSFIFILTSFLYGKETPKQDFSLFPVDIEKLKNFKKDIIVNESLKEYLKFTTLDESVIKILLELEKKKIFNKRRLPYISQNDGISFEKEGVENCKGVLCAGASIRIIDPFQAGDIPPLPPYKPKYEKRGLKAGLDQPALVGYGARFNLHVFEVLTKLTADLSSNEPQFYSHFYYPSPSSLYEKEKIFNNTKALVLQDSQGNKVCFVKNDLIGVFKDIREDIIDVLHQRGITDIDTTNLILSATHTHGGIGGWAVKLAMQVGIDLYNEYTHTFLLTQIVDAITEANNNMVPVMIGIGSGTETRVTANRRDQCDYFNEPPNTLPDYEVGVIRVDRRSDGFPLAVMLNFPIHGTSNDGEELRVNPDNIGWIERFIEDNLGGIALMFNGAEGDVKPKGSVQEIGEKLGQTVINTYNNIETTDNIVLKTAICEDDDPHFRPKHKFPCPSYFDEAQFRYLKGVEIPGKEGCFIDRHEYGPSIKFRKAFDENKFDRDGIVYSGVRIDLIYNDGKVKKVGFTTAPGEAITDIGLAVKNGGKRLGYDQVFFLGLSNSYIAYITTPEEYDQGGYEAQSTLFGRYTGNVVIENGLYVLEKLIE